METKLSIPFDTRMLLAARIENEVIVLARFNIARDDTDGFLWTGECTITRNDLSGKNGDLVMVTEDGCIIPMDDHSKIAFGDIIASSAPSLVFKTEKRFITSYVYQISILKHVKII